MLLVCELDWGLDAQQATNLVNFGSANGPTTNVGGEHPAIVLGADNTASTPTRVLTTYWMVVPLAAISG